MFVVRLRVSLLAVVCALSWTMIGCGASRQKSKSDQQTSVLYDKEKMVCKRDYPTGSHIPVTRCYPRKGADQRRDRDQSTMDNMKLTGAVNPNQ
jgi:hypothetical protein